MKTYYWKRSVPLSAPLEDLTGHKDIQRRIINWKPLSISWNLILKSPVTCSDFDFQWLPMRQRNRREQSLHRSSQGISGVCFLSFWLPIIALLYITNASTINALCWHARQKRLFWGKYVCMGVHTYGGVEARGQARLLFLRCYPSHLLRLGFSLVCGLQTRLCGTARKRERSACVHLPSTGIVSEEHCVQLSHRF